MMPSCRLLLLLLLPPLLLLFGPFLWCFLLPESHWYTSSPHPSSPHSPPRLVTLTSLQKAHYKVVMSNE